MLLITGQVMILLAFFIGLPAAVRAIMRISLASVRNQLVAVAAEAQLQ